MNCKLQLHVVYYVIMLYLVTLGKKGNGTGVAGGGLGALLGGGGAGGGLSGLTGLLGGLMGGGGAGKL